MKIRLLREWFGVSRELMFQGLSQQINEVSFNPLGVENDELGKQYLLEILKTYRALLCNSGDRTHLNKQSSRLTVDDFLAWKQALQAKLLNHKPSDSERMLRISAWLVYHLNNTEII